MKNLISYCIELDSKRLEVLELSGDDLKLDLEFFGVKKPTDLSDLDRRVFNTEQEAENFLQDYKKTLASLDNRKMCLSRDLPAMLLKRRYIVQTLMSLKSFTCRDYKKPWNPGQLFNFHDQVFFLTVRLISIEEKRDEQGFFYQYNFELPQKIKLH